MKIKTEEKGITLIALVITIIVLLILAGVSISLVAGNNGILGRATSAVETNRKATAMEHVSMAWLACQTDYLSGEMSEPKGTIFSKENLNANLSQGEIIEVSIGVDETGTSELAYKVDDVYYKIQVTSDGEVSVVGDSTSTPPIIKEPVTVIYSIAKTLTGEEIKFSNMSNTVEKGAGYNTTVTTGTYYTLESITVKMEGTEVTSGITIADDKKSGTINIASVTGNIEITVVSKTSVTSDIYKIDGAYITNIKPNTKVKDFLANVKVETEDVEVKVVKEDILDNEDILATGMVLWVGTMPYTIVVRGDVDGNGVIDLDDLEDFALIYLVSAEGGTEMGRRAADINCDGLINDEDKEMFIKVIDSGTFD